MQMAWSAKRTCEPVAIGLGVHGDGLDSEFLASANDANGNFTPVGDRILLNRTDGKQSLPILDGLAVHDELAFDDAGGLRLDSFMSFMDSMMQRTLPGWTRSPTDEPAERRAKGIRRTVPTIGDFTRTWWVGGFSLGDS